MKIEAKKIVVIILIVIVLIIWITYLYNKYNTTEIITSEEQAKIEIDEYNFGELDKVKNILNWLDKNSYSFEDLKEFNKKFNQNIKPIKNCYYLVDRNSFFEKDKWWWGFIFWFQLESKKYIRKYGVKYYAYPKYDLPNISICMWWWWSIDWWECYDRYRSKFEWTISNPCQD